MAGIARPPCDEAAILAGSCQRLVTAYGPWILSARGLQGVGGALLVPGSLALISANFPEKERAVQMETTLGEGVLAAAKITSAAYSYGISTAPAAPSPE